MNNWKFVEKDGNPKKRAEYNAIIIHEEYCDGKKTGRVTADFDNRYFDGDEWVAECGCYEGEKIYAWKEIKLELPELPDGVDDWDDWIKKEIFI